MKARDLIPGWPRPRSTLAAFELWRRPLWWFRWRPDGLLARMICLDAQGNSVYGDDRRRMLEQSKRDMEECKAEFAADAAYHKAQQFMVDEFRKNVVPLEGQHITALPRGLYGIPLCFEEGVFDTSGPYMGISREVLP